MTNVDRFALVASSRRSDPVVRGTTLIAWTRTWMRATESPRQLVTSSREHRRLASVSFGRNTDRLSKRHEATAKTNLKCLLTKQSELAALRRPRERENRCFYRLLLSMAIIFAAAPPTLPTTFRPRAVNHNDSQRALRGYGPHLWYSTSDNPAWRTHSAPFPANYIFTNWNVYLVTLTLKIQLAYLKFIVI